MKPQHTLDWANRIRWRSEATITPVALVAIEEHVRRMATVLPPMIAATTRRVAESHGTVLTPAHDSAEYAEFFDALADRGDFLNCPSRIPVIATITANAVWHLDSRFESFPNPWEPIMRLYELGYPVSYADTPKHDGVALRIGLRTGSQLFQVYGATVTDDLA